MAYEERTYRTWAGDSDLKHYRIVIKESDLAVASTVDVRENLFESLLRVRKEIEDYIRYRPEFFHSLEPIEVESDSPALVRRMAAAAALAGVGPMASVAGAVAEAIGTQVLDLTPEIIIENGGDIFLRLARERIVGLWAGKSPFTGRVGFRFNRTDPFSVCASSGTFGHSLSFGKADSAVVISSNAALADAAATALGNRVSTPDDIQSALGFLESIPGVQGGVVVVGDRIGAWGEVEIVPLSIGKNTDQH